MADHAEFNAESMGLELGLLHNLQSNLGSLRLRSAHTNGIKILCRVVTSIKRNNIYRAPYTSY